MQHIYVHVRIIMQEVLYKCSFNCKSNMLNLQNGVHDTDSCTMRVASLLCDAGQVVCKTLVNYVIHEFYMYFRVTHNHCLIEQRAYYTLILPYIFEPFDKWYVFSDPVKYSDNYIFLYSHTYATSHSYSHSHTYIHTYIRVLLNVIHKRWCATSSLASVT